MEQKTNSEIDTKLHELVELIVAQQVEEVSEMKKKIEQLEAQLLEERTKALEASATIVQLQGDLSKVQAQRLTDCYQRMIAPFIPGTTVYRANSTTKTLSCPVCNGVGALIKEIDNLEYKAKCPRCQGANYGAKKMTQGYTFYAPVCEKISFVTVDIDDTDTTIEVHTEGNIVGHSSEFIFLTEKECKDFCNDINSAALEAAKNALGIIETE